MTHKRMSDTQREKRDTDNRYCQSRDNDSVVVVVSHCQVRDFLSGIGGKEETSRKENWRQVSQLCKVHTCLSEEINVIRERREEIN